MSENLNLIYVIKQLESGLRRPFMATVKSHGMSAAQYTALAVLDRLPGITSSELARRSLVRAQSMAQTLAPLIEAGLVRRETDPEHARQILLFITRDGRERMREVRVDVQAIEDRLTSAMSEDQAAQLEKLLRLARHGLGSGEDQRPRT
ncbi:MarR family winged helix-turn-helix transcriptional regulator [Microbacterium sp. AGC85]